MIQNRRTRELHDGWTESLKNSRRHYGISDKQPRPKNPSFLELLRTDVLMFVVVVVVVVVVVLILTF